MMTHDIQSRLISANGLEFRISEMGRGPLVLLLHGFPESWYSWRHQLPALAAAGYHAVAPDMRGYGGSAKPSDIEAYDQVSLAGDVSGLITALGDEPAVVVGHDWGAPVAWNSALIHPDQVRAVAGLSVPFMPRGEYPPLDAMRMAYGKKFFYMLYFQEPGVAEAELESDVRRFLRIFLASASGEAASNAFKSEKRAGDKLLDGMVEPAGLPAWLSPEDLDFYVAEFEQNGFSTPLNWYRNLNRSWQRLADFAGAGISQPALFIAGDKDPVINFVPNSLQVMRDSLPDLRDLVMLEGCGHWTQQERPEEVNQALLTFLAGL